MPSRRRESSQLATSVVLPAPGGPTTHRADRRERSSSSRANRRSRGTASCTRGRVSLASVGTCMVATNAPRVTPLRQFCDGPLAPPHQPAGILASVQSSHDRALQPSAGHEAICNVTRLPGGLKVGSPALRRAYRSRVRAPALGQRLSNLSSSGHPHGELGSRGHYRRRRDREALAGGLPYSGIALSLSRRSTKLDLLCRMPGIRYSFSRSRRS